MFKNLAVAVIALIVVLQIPLSEWKTLLEKQREVIRQETTVAVMKKLGPGSMARVWEDIMGGMWRLHIESVDSIAPAKNKIKI
jgi:hypothetical protein